VFIVLKMLAYCSIQSLTHKFYLSHPNNINFLEVLYGVQADTRVILRSSKVVKPRRKGIQNKIQFIENQIQIYDAIYSAISRFHLFISV